MSKLIGRWCMWHGHMLRRRVMTRRCMWNRLLDDRLLDDRLLDDRLLDDRMLVDRGRHVLTWPWCSSLDDRRWTGWHCCSLWMPWTGATAKHGHSRRRRTISSNTPITVRGHTMARNSCRDEKWKLWIISQQKRHSLKVFR